MRNPDKELAKLRKKVKKIEKEDAADAKAVKKIEEAELAGAKALRKRGRGVIELSRIPFGFYEDEQFQYFSQFGKVTRLRLSMSKK
ncbi:hypothetical protein T484DRAFT_1841577 [Baffinella frigidus]|nr:hypothetical protein T484DRAFT_1841577 [Cryptophyta sp. CCMP2293]